MKQEPFAAAGPVGCESEPIHIPGKIQPHGLLFVLDDDFLIRQIGGLTEALLGYTADQLLETPFLALIQEDAIQPVKALIREAAHTFVNPFLIPVKSGDQVIHFDGIAHAVEGAGTILELEAQEAEKGASAPIYSGLDNYLQIIQRSLGKISGVHDETRVAETVVEEVRSFTGFDRVMVYKFAADGHGYVIAEEKADDLEPFLGLHYPASDIPAQARELYLRNPVRLLRDVEASPVPIIPALNPRTGQPLDLTKSVLRALSPVHVQYLKNMRVGSSMSASLVVDGKLWGLIACHHHSGKGVPYAIRATLSLYAIVMAAQLKVKLVSRENRRIAEARSMALSILTGLRDYSEPFGSLPAMLPNLRELFEADGAALLTESEIYRHGTTPEDRVLYKLLAELGEGSSGGTVVTDRSPKRFPSLHDSTRTAAGLVAIHLGQREWLIMFRGEAVQSITWAGNPYTGKDNDPAQALTPRNSFTAWLEEVSGASEAWPPQTIALTTEVRAGILEILRNRNVLLTRSNQDLRRFAGVVAHEVKNHMQSALMALALVREQLGSTMSPGLLELTSNGQDRLADLSRFTNEMLSFSQLENQNRETEVDIAALVDSVIRDQTLSGNADGVVISTRGLPKVVGEPSQLKHLISNLIRNAILHGRRPDRILRIEVGSRLQGNEDVIFVRDDGKGIPPEHRERIFEYFYQGDSQSGGSGIGLSFCQQVVERAGHRIWVEDSPGDQGATFCFTVTVARHGEISSDS